jgi:hypothetical protein
MEHAEDGVDGEERGWFRQSRGRVVAAPRPVGRRRTDSSPDRIQDNVATRFAKMLVGLDDNASKPLPKGVVRASSISVRPAGIAAVEIAHSLRESRLGGMHDDVVVVRHQAPGVDEPAVPDRDPREHPRERDHQNVVRHHRASIVASRANVEEATRKVVAWAPHPLRFAADEPRG